MNVELKFLELADVKKHLHIDTDIYDDELMIYMASAENAALKFMERDLASIFEEYYQIPVDIIHACMCRVATSFKYREDVTDRNLYRLPYSWENLLLPYAANI